MLYIVTEDENSGYDFYVAVVNILFGGNAKVISTQGNYGMPKVLNGLRTSNKLHKGDDILVCFDNISSANLSSSLIDLKNSLIQEIGLLSLLGVNVTMTQYASFEWLMLTFTLLLDYSSNSSISVCRNDYLDNVVKEIQSGKFCNMLKLKSLPGISSATDEKALKSLLAIVTTHGKFNWFKISDSEFGPCWKEDCEDRNIESYAKHYCSGCYVTRCNRLCLNKYLNRIYDIIKYSEVKEVLRPYKSLMKDSVCKNLYGKIN